MKIFNSVLALILVNLFTNETYGEYYRDINNNLCNENWWKMATVEELDSELIKQHWDINNDKCDVPSYASSNEKIIYIACSNSNDSHITKYLIDKGANIKDIDNEGNTLLIYLDNSIYAKVAHMIKFLLDNGLNIDSANNKGETALIKACQQGKDLSEMQIEFICSGSNKQEFITALLDNGANVNIKDNLERTALDYAEENPIVRCSEVFYRLRDLMTNKVN